MRAMFRRTLPGVLSMVAVTGGIAPAEQATILETVNIVQSSARGTSGWTAAKTDEKLAVGDRIRTRQRSRATLRLSDLYTMRLEQFTTVEIVPGLLGTDKPRLDLGAGAAFIFSREKSGEIDIKTPAANGAMRGTQLFVQVAEDGTSHFQVLEGSVELGNGSGKLMLNAGEAGEASPGRAPRRTAVIEAVNLLQWALHYPAVLDPDELGMSSGGSKVAAKSLAAYRSGDLLGALEKYPASTPGSKGDRLFRSAVLLGAGRLDEARKGLAGIPAQDSGRRAIERLADAVKFREGDQWADADLRTAGEAIAESYYRQSRSDLAGALDAARIATRIRPENGFAWTRVAELEFSFGRTRQARTALESALEFTPCSARAHALRGFILSADNRIDEARAEFEEALRLDPSFGNAWLGRGLTKTKRGDLAGGRADIQTAATVEPTISVFHSYLGKALSMENKPLEAGKDLDLARRLDPNDPTPWLYSAIEKQQRNRINEAIGDLNESILLNDNRRVYRSQFLLDQDRAVRSSNLAQLYQDAGMRDVAVREATRAVEVDYTNSSAHLFLANSYDSLRDPRRVQLRYETPWFNELLISNLLSPVGGGPLSQFVSQQEYSKMLESDGIGASVLSELWTNGESRTATSVFGTHGNVSYGIDYYLREGDMDRPDSNARLEEIYGQFKWQATPDDIFYFLGKFQDQKSGDNFDNYDNVPTEPDVKFEEQQDPGLLLAGWNHRWAPGSNTLFFGGYLSAEQTLRNPNSSQLLVERDSAALRPGFITSNQFGFDVFTDPALNNANPLAVGFGPDGESLIYSGDLLRAIRPYLGSGDVISAQSAPFDFETHREWGIYTAELQHILQTDRNLLIAGGRMQAGEFETQARLLAARPNFLGGFETPAVEQSQTEDFNRASLYLYDYWNVLPDLTLIGGVAWDRIEHPENFRYPPLGDGQRDDDGFSGKFGFNYVPCRWVTFRGAYAEGLGGVTFDESVRLEPVQIAGFNQAYRTVISESLAGSVETPRYEIYGLSAEGSLPSRTWWGLSWNMIEQDVDRSRGIFTGYSAGVFPSTPAYFADNTTEHLDYEEQSITFTLNQLLGDQFSAGAGLRVTRSELHTTLPELIGAGAFTDITDEATLSELMFNLNWNSPTGLFARIEANYYHQDLDDDPTVPPRSGDSFWQFNALAGYRFLDNRCEISAGVLNIGGTDYNLSPLNPREEILRERTGVLQMRMTF